MKGYKKGDEVEDTWYPGVLRVVKVLKTRLHVKDAHGRVIVYDPPHARQFLRPRKTTKLKAAKKGKPCARSR